MKFNKKLLSSLAVLLVAPTFLFACVSGGSEEGKVDPDPTPTPDPEPEEYKGLKFTATQKNSKIGYSISSSLPDIHIQCSLDGGITWADWDGAYKILNVNDTLCVRNTNETLSNENHYFRFKITDGKISASGNVNSMINNGPLSSYCYYFMFNGCTSLTSAPELPATNLAKSCYDGMFRGCTSLASMPDLPADSLAEFCYESMFKGCTSLTSVPDLPATTLAFSCYGGMFEGCTSLISIPKLDTSKLAVYCYYKMFKGCTTLTSAPELPATTLMQGCYESMFEGCTNLKIKEETGAVEVSNKIFVCPPIDDNYNPVTDMFKGTTGDFSTNTPTEGNTYHWYIEEE